MNPQSRAAPCEPIRDFVTSYSILSLEPCSKYDSYLPHPVSGHVTELIRFIILKGPPYNELSGFHSAVRSAVQ